MLWFYVGPSGFPDVYFLRRNCSLKISIGVNFSTLRAQKNPTLIGFLLAHQVSNLNSSEPKSDVLPVTPWAKLAMKNKQSYHTIR